MLEISPTTNRMPTTSGSPPSTSNQRKDLVALLQGASSRSAPRRVEQHPQHQEEEDHEDLAHGRQYDVLLRVARRGAASGSAASCPGRVPSWPPAARCPPRTSSRSSGPTRGRRRRGSATSERLLLRAPSPHREVQRLHDEEDRQHEAPDQAQRLERIGPDQRLHAPWCV